MPNPDTAYYGEKVYGQRASQRTSVPRATCAWPTSPSRAGLSSCRAAAPRSTRARRARAWPARRQALQQHGGGVRVGEGRGNGVCTHCKTTGSAKSGSRSHGGNGLCPTCENRLEAEAEANGYEGPIQSLRWEERVFNLLLPLLTYADGTPFPPEQRDERKGGGLGTPSTKKRSRECDTTTNRFPDGLWILRDADGRAVLVLIVEVDEHSHTDRKPTCESGKIDDTFQSLQNKLAKEGAARGAVARHDAHMIPIITIRTNPNKYDKKIVHLPERVKAAAKLINSYLHMDAEAIAKLQTHAAIVHVMFYHTKEGFDNLAHYATRAPQAGWEYTVH